jgi:hypothetical protein
MDLEKKHIIYTAEDILEYLSGKLSPSEMHAMEKAALDDPFLAEAMEGYAGMQEKELKEQLQFLKEAISKTPAPETIVIKQAIPICPLANSRSYTPALQCNWTHLFIYQ